MLSTRNFDVSNIGGYQAGSAWPHYRGVSNSNAALSPYLGAQSNWSLGTHGTISSGVAIGANGTIYFGTNSYFYAVNAKGSVEWSIYGQNTATAVISANGDVYYPTTQYLYGFSPQGSQVFFYQNMNQYYASPAIGSNGNIYIGDIGGNFVSITPKGLGQWNVATGGPICSSPAIAADGTIYFGGYNNEVWAIASSGSVLWRYTNAYAPYTSVYSSPAIDSNGYIYIGLASGNLCVLSPNGNHVGSFTGESSASFGYNSPSIGPDGTVYIGDSSGYVYALNPSTGGNPTLKWAHKTTGYFVTSVAVASDGTLWFGSNNAYLYNLYPSGSIRNSYYIGSGASGPPSVTADGTVYIGAGSYLKATYVATNAIKSTHSYSRSLRSVDFSKDTIESTP